jgi:hypothetical protein
MGDLRLAHQSSDGLQVLDDVLVGSLDVLALEVGNVAGVLSARGQRARRWSVATDDAVAP